MQHAVMPSAEEASAAAEIALGNARCLAAMRDNTLRATLQTMREHPDDVSLQSASVRSLLEFAGLGRPHVLIREGGVGAAVSALRHTHDPGVIMTVFTLLSTVAQQAGEADKAEATAEATVGSAAASLSDANSLDSTVRSGTGGATTHTDITTSSSSLHYTLKSYARPTTGTQASVNQLSGVRYRLYGI